MASSKITLTLDPGEYAFLKRLLKDEIERVTGQYKGTEDRAFRTDCARQLEKLRKFEESV